MATQEKIINNASRMLMLLFLMDIEISYYNIEGISIWSNNAFECMLNIELDNNLYLQGVKK